MTTPPKKEPAIRTMRSDISEFLKTTKPSLISLLARQAQLEEYRTNQATRRIPLKALALFSILGIIVIGGGIAYLIVGPEFRSPRIMEKAPLEPPIIFFESTSEIIVEKKLPTLLATLQKTSREKQTPGSFRRLIIRVKSDGTAEDTQEIKLGEFFELASQRLPPAFSQNINARPQFFIYQQSSGPQLGIMLAASQPARVFRDLLFSEASLQRDLEVMFLGSLLPPGLDSFRDLTYKNIDFRFLRLDEPSNRGLGYLFFPAQRLIVITTSEETVHRTIDRLFQNR